ncbi:hypothetical protein C0991_009112 [Blastosporella zonata]|nr:hypothetical protein C0991_009112 [Blastosporella zonata]
MAVDKNDETDFLQTVNGETSFFRSITRARPIGIHRHFHILTIREAIFKDTNCWVPVDDLWVKLRSCYDLDALEAIDLEAEGYESPISKRSPPLSIPSPDAYENLAAHPFFREEFALPYDESIETMIAERRMRATASPPSSPVASPPSPPRGKKRGRTKLSMAGLVGGDSDSSALTQESGDEGDGGASSPRASSVVTGTDPGTGTDHVEEEDSEMREPSIAPSTSPKPTRGRGKYTKKGAVGRGRGGGRGGSEAASISRPPKKRKR